QAPIPVNRRWFKHVRRAAYFLVRCRFRGRKQETIRMSSLAVSTDHHVELPSVDSCHDSTISRPRYLVLQSLIGIMLAYQLLSGAELIASRPMSIIIVAGLAAMVLCLWYVPTSILQSAWFSGTLIGIDTIL